MSMRRLFAILVAMWVLFAPSVAAAAERGMTMADHETQMMEMGHCESPPSGPADHDKNKDHGCCIAMCIALAVTPLAPLQSSPLRQQVAGFVATKTYHGLPAEIATPPPRHS